MHKHRMDNLHKNGDGINDIVTEKQISINKQQKLDTGN
jgi:hypothetical protein